MERGSVVLVSAQGDFGKARPAAVVQSDRLVGLIEMTSDMTKEGPMRVTIPPTTANGLRVVSQVQVEKLLTFPIEKVRGPIGTLTEGEIASASRASLFVLDLAQPLAPPDTA